MKIACIVSVFNEIDLIPQFLTHYYAQGVDHFFVFDNYSTDGTYEYVQMQQDCTAVRYGHVDQLDDMLKCGELQRCKTAIQEQYDYVIMPDCDEFLVSSDGMTLKQYIETYPKCIYGSIGYNMVQHATDSPYNPHAALTEQRKHGFPFAPYSKSIVCTSDFDGEWGAGMHNVYVDHKVIQPAPDFLLLHYVAFDETVSLKRRRRQTERTGFINIQRGHGAGNVGMTESQWREWLKGHWEHPETRKVI